MIGKVVKLSQSGAFQKFKFQKVSNKSLQQKIDEMFGRHNPVSLKYHPSRIRILYV